MKKGFILICSLVLILLGYTEISAQQISIVRPNNTSPSNPRSVCQCDTIGLPGTTTPNGLQYFLAGNFSPLTKFFYELAPGGDWTQADSLQLFQLEAVPSTAPLDTFSQGTKKAYVIVPCNFAPGAASIRIRNSNGEISDTAFLTVNTLPAKPIIESISAGFPNPYTTLNDWGFCSGDSIVLRADDHPGATYQWLVGGAPIPGEVNDTLVVKTSGNYSVRVDLGACSRDSRDTLINTFLPPTQIILFSAPPVAHQIDNPNPSGFPLDSVQFCENSSAILQANAPAPSTGLTFNYTWLTDSITQFGDTVFFPARGVNNMRQYTVDTSGRFYVIINDGFCTDTSLPYFAFEDTIPAMVIKNQNYQNGILGALNMDNEICMTDSVLLSAGVIDTTRFQYQWQRFNTSTRVWQNISPSSIPNPNFDGKDPQLQVDTSMKPIQSLSFYRLVTNTFTPFSKSKVCEFISDSIVVRWKPEDFITHQSSPLLRVVDKNSIIDSINFCARDSALLIASATPGQLITNGYFYNYQWVRDSLDTALNKFVKVPISGAVNQILTVKETGNYYVVIDDGICVDTVRKFSVFVDSIPSTSIVNIPSTVDRNLCIDENVTISATDSVLGFNHWNYQWLINTGSGWGPSPNDTLPWLTVDTSYRPLGVDTIWFALATAYTNRFGNMICPDVTDSISVQFFDPPTIGFFPGDSIGVCPGDSVLVIAQGNSLSYLWDDGATTADTWLSGAGTYTVTGTGINQCTAQRQIKIYDIVTNANAGSDVTILSGQTANLSASGGTGYQWGASKPISWGNILSANTTVSYTLPEGVKSDTIKIYVRVSNTDGCAATDTLLLFVNSPEGPGTSLIDQAWNVFTPDGNGKSDVWDIHAITNKYGGCRIDIMNRWGSVVYTNENFNGRWDGNNNGGNPLADGTYYYILSCDGEIILKNAVTIIRNQ